MVDGNSGHKAQRQLQAGQAALFEASHLQSGQTAQAKCGHGKVLGHVDGVELMPATTPASKLRPKLKMSGPTSTPRSMCRAADSEAEQPYCREKLEPKWLRKAQEKRGLEKWTLLG